AGQCLGGPGGETIYVDHMRITVYYVTAGPVADSYDAGQVSTGSAASFSVTLGTGALVLSDPVPTNVTGGADYAGTQPGLVYNSAPVSPQPIFNVTVDTSATPLPDSIQARLTFNGSTGSWVTFSTTGHSAGDNYLLALQVGSAVGSTGYYSWQIDI